MSRKIFRQIYYADENFMAHPIWSGNKLKIKMKKLVMVGCWLVSGLNLIAHPGIGIVKDSKGNIYYTDLKQVWKISLDGTKNKIVNDVHTHELYMDQQDNLYGEHLWYNGEQADTWGHYAWCLKNNGDLIKELGPKEGFLTNYSFVRDSSGNMYWVERFTTSRIMKKTKSGEIIKMLEGKFGFIGWLFSTKNGILYFTESNKLRRLLPDGNLETVAENIGSRSTDFTVMGRNYSSYGIWTDASDNIYLAMLDAKKVVRVGPDGKPETIMVSNSTWTVCSGIFDNGGNLWLLENSVTNEVRARMISQQEMAGGKTANQPMKRSHLLVTILTVLGILFLFIVTRSIIYKKSTRHLNIAA